LATRQLPTTNYELRITNYELPSTKHSIRTEYTRDRTGNPLSILREDGSCVYYEYDLNQQLTAETQTDDLGAVVYAWEWDYDRAGNRTWGAATSTLVS